ncbi:hypothetical protein ABPG74_015882 [Tetrahymena malaccensis]
MIYLFNFFQIFSLLTIRLFVKGQSTNIVSDPSLPSCQNTPGKLWDLSQCSTCYKNSNLCYCQAYNICDSCISGYFLNKNTQTCQQCPQNCAICCQRESLTEYICSQCNQDYTLVGGVCIYTLGCKQLIPNTDKCLQCLDGYYLDQNSKCQKCHQNCKTCLTEFDCITCNSNISNVSNGNICIANVTPTTPKQQIPDCIFKQDENKYGTGTNVDLTDNCYHNPQSQSYSYRLDISTGKCKCTQCMEGFYLSVSVINNVPTYNCINCDPNKIDNTQKSNYSKRCIQDQSNPNSVIIIECDDTKNQILDLSTQQCVDNTDSNCRRMFAGDCSDCYERYYPELDLDTNNIKCYQQQVPNCLKFVSKGTQCKQCLDGYFLQDGLCQSCTSGCSTDSCMICTKCQSATQCLQCNSGYRLKNGSCVSCINPNCSQCDQVENVCTKCKPGYGLNTQSKDDQDQCLQCQSDCLVCDVEFRKCTQCSEGFYIQNFVCKKQPDNCVLQENGFCIQCAFGYIAQAGYCIKCSNQDIGYYTCPSKCDDSQIQLVDLLHSQILKNSILFYFLIYFGFVQLPFINFR